MPKTGRCGLPSAASSGGILHDPQPFAANFLANTGAVPQLRGFVAAIREALDVAIAHGYSRMPVVHDRDGEDAVGLAYLKDLINPRT